MKFQSNPDKKRRGRKILAVLAALVILCCGATQVVLAYPSDSGALHVEGTRLMGSGGQPVQLRGVSTHGLAWFPQYVNEACLKQLRQEWGANVFRIAVYTEEYGGYCSGGDRAVLKQKIREAAAEESKIMNREFRFRPKFLPGNTEKSKRIAKDHRN